MYAEITSRLKAIDAILEGPNFYHIDQRMEAIVKNLQKGMEFLGQKLYELETTGPKPIRERQGFTDPHRYLPGSDD
jgi:hypothetical protein